MSTEIICSQVFILWMKEYARNINNYDFEDLGWLVDYLNNKVKLDGLTETVSYILEADKTKKKTEMSYCFIISGSDFVA